MPDLDFEDAQPLQGRPVTLRAGDVQRSATLTEVTALTRHPGHSRQPFTMTFVTDSADALPQQIFSVEFEGQAPVEIFLVSIGPLDGGMGYEAVFN
jgi:hypothetical protein